jgi:hypothetical protein
MEVGTKVYATTTSESDDGYTHSPSSPVRRHVVFAGAARFDPCHAAAAAAGVKHMYGTNIFWVGSSYRYDNGEYVPSLSSPPSPAPSNTSNSFSLKNRKSWIGR